MKSLKLVFLPSTDLRIKDINAFTGLHKMLKRGRLAQQHYRGDIDCGLQNMGVVLSGTDVPVAAIERYACGLTPQLGEWCIKAQPVTLTPNRDDLVLRNNIEAPLRDSEEQALVDELNEYLVEHKVLIRRLAAWQWIIESPRSYQIETSEIAETSNRNIGEHFITGDDAAIWRAIGNEIQMWFHQKQMSLSPESKAKLPNSLWFWGAGVLPVQALESPSDLIVSSSLFHRGIAKLTGSECIEPKQFLSNHNRFVQNHDNIIFFPSNSNEVILLDEIDENVISPVLNSFQQISLIFPNGKSLSLNQYDKYCFWRKARTLEEIFNIA